MLANILIGSAFGICIIGFIISVVLFILGARKSRQILINCGFGTLILAIIMAASGTITILMNNGNDNLPKNKENYKFSWKLPLFNIETNIEDNDSKQETEIIEGTCIYCDGQLDADDKKSVCDDCKNDPLINGHFESQAPYGRCGGCNCALLEDGQVYCSQCNERTGTVCAVCEVPLRHYHELGSWKDSFCSQECENHWYEEYARTNQKDYCDYCGKETTVGQTETWGGCCSELCAVNKEGNAYEEWESQYPNGQCGWCGGYITDEAAGLYGYGSMCSQHCESEYEAWYEANY